MFIINGTFTACKIFNNITNFFSLKAPGSYDVEKVEKTVHQASPAYSFGVKYKEYKTETLPGNDYLMVLKAVIIDYKYYLYFFF